MEDAALSILQRAPPGDLEKNLQGVSEILAQQQDNAAVEQVALIKSNRSHYVVPFRVYQPPPPLSDDDANKKKKEEEEEKPFLQCQYNRVGDHQYRSPWTNRLYPPTHGKKDDDDDLTTATTTTTTMAKNTTTETTTTTTTTSNEQESELRLLEVTTNEVWDSYKKLYYGANATGSVFLRPLLSSNKQGNNNNNNNNSNSKAFKGLFGIYKPMAEEEEEAETLTTTATSSWHSVSIVQVEEPGEETCVYKVDTTVLVALNSRSDTKSSSSSSSSTAVAELDWDSSALVSKSVIKECKIQPHILSTSHIENLGQLIEANEMELRSSLERVQMPKLVETVDALLKRKKKSFKPAVNPIMGMIMDSDILKRKKSTTGVTADPAVDSSDDNKSDQAAAAATATATTTTSNSRSSAPPKNHMMGMVMNSDELKQKLAKQAAGGD